MAVETEIKFPSKGFEAVRARLRCGGVLTEAAVLERNLVFDTPERTLRARNMLLRLRLRNKVVLCLKTPPNDVRFDDVKRWEETETEVEDIDAMRGILLGLGFEVAFRYEKIREKWRWGRCTVCLDRLPFGTFVEVEGERDDIFRCARELNLDIGSGTTSTYHDLNQEHRKARGLPAGDSFVFEDPGSAVLE